jgi:hypothetical protein
LLSAVENHISVRRRGMLSISVLSPESRGVTHSNERCHTVNLEFTSPSFGVFFAVGLSVLSVASDCVGSDGFIGLGSSWRQLERSIVSNPYKKIRIFYLFSVIISYLKEEVESNTCSYN